MTIESSSFPSSKLDIETSLQAYFPKRCVTPQPCPKARNLIDVAVSSVIDGFAAYEDIRRRVNRATQDFQQCHYSEICHSGGALPLPLREQA